MSKKIYLAIPFSGIEDLSFKCANEVASLLIAQGHYVYSPISHSVPIWKTGMVAHTYEVWMRQDEEFVKWAEEIFVVNIIGHFGLRKIENSPGVQKELAWAKEQGKRIMVVNYNPKLKTIVSFTEL